MKDSCDKAWVRGIMAVVRPFLHLKTVGSENIRKADGAAVFIGNHGAVFGVVSAVIYLPVRFKVWLHDVMIIRESAAKTMEGTFQNRFRFFGKKFKRKLIWWISKPVCSALNSFSPIPVSRTNPMAIPRTLAETIDALCEGYNVLLFPEKPEGYYGDKSYKDIYPAFGILGKKYYDQTGMSLSFYPIFSDKKRRLFSIGKPVVYSPQSSLREEAQRIASEVKDKMLKLSGDEPK